jgi:hypothetical protein
MSRSGGPGGVGPGRGGGRPGPGGAPPGWPAAVPPPGAPEWERRAVGWLFELCPPEYRGYPVLVRHPLLLARLAAEQVAAGLAGGRHGLATLRGDLAAHLPPDAIEAAVGVYEQEALRLAAVGRAVAAVTRALRGERYVPRL